MPGYQKASIEDLIVKGQLKPYRKLPLEVEQMLAKMDEDVQ